jgi:4'-phosphopantetheinyl transferase
LPEVTVWWAADVPVRPEWARLLSSAERERWRAYRSTGDRDRFLAGAVLVRMVLGTLLRVPPETVRLDRTCPDCRRPHGRIDAGPAAGVSVSYSGRWIVVAAAAGAVDLGVDVERVDPGVDHLGVGRLVLAPAELAGLREIPDRARAAAFTRYWTRKEAVVKAAGVGLRSDLTVLRVSPPDHPPAVLSWPAWPGPPMRLTDLDPDPSHRAALAVAADPPVTIAQRDARELLAVAV